MEYKQFEYKVHYLQLKVGRSKEEQLFESLNTFGKDGWRLNRLYPERSFRAIASWKGGVNLLLERECEAK